VRHAEVAKNYNRTPRQASFTGGPQSRLVTRSLASVLLDAGLDPRRFVRVHHGRSSRFSHARFAVSEKTHRLCALMYRTSNWTSV
jgi:hypothetical protein